MALTEKRRLWQIEYRKRNREKTNEYALKYYHENGGKEKQSTEEIKNYRREWARNAYKKRYNNDPEYRERVKAASRKSYQKNKIKCKARMAVARAVAKGELTRPENCSQCDRTDLRIDGHHEDYNKPLNVEWLCSECHGLRHRKERK